jgi:hypothetical protein
MTAPASLKDRIKDALERAGSAAGEQFLAIVVTADLSHGLLNLPWALALSTAAGAAVVSVLLTVGQFALGAQVLPFWADVAVRSVKSFAASLLATLGGGAVDIVSVPWTHALNVAGLAAFLSVVKCYFSPNAHLSGSLLSTQTVARIHGVTVSGGGYTPI